MMKKLKILLLVFFFCNSVFAKEVVQWSAIELTFESKETVSWRKFPLQVEFTNGKHNIILDAFWDGGNIYKVRFTPTNPGVWRYKTKSILEGLNNKKGEISCVAPTREQIEANINLRGFLETSKNGHYFTYADGTPVLIFADCQLLATNSFDIFKKLLANRKSLGFNALNMRLAKRKDSNEGGRPYLENQIDSLNPDYFEWIDKRLSELWNSGFISIFMPDFMGNSGYTYDEVRDITRYLMARYATYNTMYIVTGEYDSKRNEKIWSSLDNWYKIGNTLKEINDIGYNIPVGTHPLNGSSSDEMHTQEWLAYNQIQSKMWDEFNTVPYSVLHDYNKIPAKPTFYAEGIYENQMWPPTPNDLLKDSKYIRHPFTYGSPFVIRHQIWVPLTCGATVIDYGETRVKNGVKDEEELKSIENQSGVLQASNAIHLLRSLNWWKMKPHREWVLVNGIVPPIQRQALNPYPYCIAEPDKAYLIYIMGNSEEELTLSNLKAGQYTAKWYDPRKDNFIAINGGNSFYPDNKGEWELPARPKDPLMDWVLIVENKD